LAVCQGVAEGGFDVKIRIDQTGNDVHIEAERDPMPQERFQALCKLAGAAIGGIVLLGAVRMIGAWAVAWAVGALLLAGLYKLIRSF